jgi:hypothetical protein
LRVHFVCDDDYVAQHLAEIHFCQDLVVGY